LDDERTAALAHEDVAFQDPGIEAAPGGAVAVLSSFHTSRFDGRRKTRSVQRERSRPFSICASNRDAVSLILVSWSVIFGCWAMKSIVFRSAVPNHVPSSSAALMSFFSISDTGAPCDPPVRSSFRLFVPSSLIGMAFSNSRYGSLFNLLAILASTGLNHLTAE